MGLMMSGELHSLDDGQAAAAAALEMEDLAIDTDKLHLNLNVCWREQIERFGLDKINFSPEFFILCSLPKKNSS